MKKLFAALLPFGLLVLVGCGKASVSAAVTTTDASTVAAAATEAPTTEETETLDPTRPKAIMEPVQGGPMLYPFTGKNGKLGLINQDGELVAAPQYEPSNTWNYSAEFLVDVKYSYDATGRVNGITLQKGAKGEQFVHYTLDGKSRPVEGFPENSDRNAFIKDGLYSYKTEGADAIYDASKKLLYTTKPGEEAVFLYPVPYESHVMGLVVQDAQGAIIKAFDHDGKPMQPKSEAQFYSDQYLFGGTLYQLKDGKWISLDLRQFIKPDVEEHCAVAMTVSEDWVMVATGPAYEGMAIEEEFVVDWNGKPYEGCPLAPFMSKHWFPTAGEQGPHYYWVEHNGKRGYINTKGEWIFVESSIEGGQP